MIHAHLLSFFIWTSFIEYSDISYNQISGEVPYNIGFLQVATL
jgi:hypothetical protein